MLCEINEGAATAGVGFEGEFPLRIYQRGGLVSECPRMSARARGTVGVFCRLEDVVALILRSNKAEVALHSGTML